MLVPRRYHLERLTLTNYRRFERFSIDLDPKLTVLVAANGGGKTALLDAIAIAIRYFVDELREEGSHGFDGWDVRLALGSTGAMIEMLPVALEAAASIDGKKTSWRRELASRDRKAKTTYAEASELKARARELLGELREFGDGKRAEPPTLPLIAYYGTGRLWNESRLTKARLKAARNFVRQTEAYLDCLTPSSSYGHFVAWFESVVREAQNELHTGTPSPHNPRALVEAVRNAVDEVLRPSGWRHLDWDFLRGEVVAYHPKGGRLPVILLSDGVRNLIALVADLAHRAVRLNPHLGASACLRTPGIVLIDEVDMHLHPRWQQTIVASFQAAFPEVQFIVSTHSHLVVSTVASESIRLISDDGEVTGPSLETEGADSPLALSDVFGVNSTPPGRWPDQLAEYRVFVEHGEHDSDSAKKVFAELVQHFGPSHPAILEVEGLVRLQRFKARRTARQ